MQNTLTIALPCVNCCVHQSNIPCNQWRNQCVLVGNDKKLVWYVGKISKCFSHLLHNTFITCYAEHLIISWESFLCVLKTKTPWNTHTLSVINYCKKWSLKLQIATKQEIIFNRIVMNFLKWCLYFLAIMWHSNIEKCCIYLSII